MSIKYVLDSKGNIVDTSTRVVSPDGASDDFLKFENVIELHEVFKDVLPEEFKTHGKLSIELGELSNGGVTSSSILKNNLLNEIPNDPSFGFVGDLTGSRTSFKPMYHFTDSNKYFAKEFEMLTGYTGLLTGEDFSPNTDIMGFIFNYFVEIISLISIAEIITSANQIIARQSTSGTRVIERFDLRLGKYSITEFDIYSKYMFTVINYPKDKSNLLTRITSLFLGFTAWVTPDNAISLERIFEEAGRNGSKQIENVYGKIMQV